MSGSDDRLRILIAERDEAESRLADQIENVDRLSRKVDALGERLRTVTNERDVFLSRLAQLNVQYEEQLCAPDLRRLRDGPDIDRVRRAVRIAEEEIQNIWDQGPSPAVLARTVVYALGRIT